MLNLRIFHLGVEMWVSEELEHTSNTHTLEAQAQLEQTVIIKGRIKNC